MEIKKFSPEKFSGRRPSDYNDKFQVLYFEQTYF